MALPPRTGKPAALARLESPGREPVKAGAMGQNRLGRNVATPAYRPSG